MTGGNALWHEVGANPRADPLVDALRQVDASLGALRAGRPVAGGAVREAMREAMVEAGRGGVSGPVAWLLGRMAAGQLLFDLLDEAVAVAVLWCDGA